LIPDAVLRALARPDLRAVVGHFWFGLHAFLTQDFLYVTFLREPVARDLSLFHHLVYHYGYDGSLDDFVSDPPVREVDNDQIRRLSGCNPGIGRCDDQILDRAKQHLADHFGMVGLTERFDESLILIKRKLGWARELLLLSPEHQSQQAPGRLGPPLHQGRNPPPKRVGSGALPLCVPALRADAPFRARWLR
jgi:hypothetical protein